MSIYRGAGGSGDATNDATVSQVQTYASQAATSATNAAASATAAAGSASGAATSATLATSAKNDSVAISNTVAGYVASALASEAAASGSATAAAASAAAAALSEGGASGSASDALDSANTATIQATAASTSATNSANSAASALAIYGNTTAMNTAVTNAGNSATAAATSATNASTSASNASTSASAASSSTSAASTSASAAATSAGNAATSASNASSSASAASSSASSASTSASTATTQASNASTSATSATNSASTATTQAGIATTGATTATTQAGIATTQATNASTSATTATTQAGIATTQATNAATSATNAANSETNSLANRNAAATSATNASTSASAASTSATSSATSASAAATSAAAASAVALGNEPVRHSVRPSLLLDFANTKQLDPRITFTRASTATFYDGKTTAKAEENLLIYSQELDNAVWTKDDITVTANSIAAPDGTTTADTITDTVLNSDHRAINSLAISCTAGLAYTFSIFVKNLDKNFIQLAYSTAAFSANAYANFDISTGVLGTVGSGTTATITSVGSGWYRCAITVTASATTTATPFIALITSATAVRSELYAGTLQSLYVWGAQAEQRSSVSAYTPTTTAAITNYIPALQTAASGVPRFDHNPTTGESLGLLIEEQRTNLEPYSEQFDNAYWGKVNATIASNQTIAPDGTLTADLATSNSGNYIEGFSSTTAQTVTGSIYVKGYLGTVGKTIVLRLVKDSYAELITSTAFTLTSSWQRITLTGTFATAPTTSVRLRIDFTPTGGVSTDSTFIWGTQLEAGAFATSYIPTVASQVTRSPDAASLTGTNFSSWYRADRGSLYSEFVAPATSTNLNANVVQLGGTSANAISLHRDSGSTSWRFRTNLANLNLTNAQFNSSSNKIAFAYASSDYPISINGNTIGSNTGVGLVGAADQLIIGSGNQYASAAPVNGTIKKIAYYTVRLTNQELQALTTI